LQQDNASVANHIVFWIVLLVIKALLDGVWAKIPENELIDSSSFQTKVLFMGNGAVSPIRFIENAKPIDEFSFSM